MPSASYAFSSLSPNQLGIRERQSEGAKERAPANGSPLYYACRASVARLCGVQQQHASRAPTARRDCWSPGSVCIIHVCVVYPADLIRACSFFFNSRWWVFGVKVLFSWDSVCGSWWWKEAEVRPSDFFFFLHWCGCTRVCVFSAESEICWRW